MYVALVDRGRGHLWKPLLHEVAAGSMDVDEHELDYLAQAHWHHFRFRYGEMIGLDRARKEVVLAPTHDEEGREITPRRCVPYDTLVIAIGSVINDFGTPGVKEHAIALDRTDQAARFNRRFPVDLVEPTGPDTLVFASINGKPVCCRVHPDQACAAGQSMELQFNVSKAVFFDPETEKRLA